MAVVCPFCFGKKLRKYGKYKYAGVDGQKWLCVNCNGVTAFPLRRVPTKRQKHVETNVL